MATPTKRIHDSLPRFDGPWVPAIDCCGDDCWSVLDEVVPPEGLLPSLGQETLQNIRYSSRLLRRCFLQHLTKHPHGIEVI